MQNTHFESVDNFNGNCCFIDVDNFGEFVALRLAGGGLTAKKNINLN